MTRRGKSELRMTLVWSKNASHGDLMYDLEDPRSRKTSPEGVQKGLDDIVHSSRDSRKQSPEIPHNRKGPVPVESRMFRVRHRLWIVLGFRGNGKRNA